MGIHAWRLPRDAGASESAVRLGVVGSGNWFTALQVHAWSYYELGRFSEAIRTADEDIEQAYRHGDRSAMIIPLAVDAIVLKALGELDTVAIIRGRLPLRLTVVMIRELAEIDRKNSRRSSTRPPPGVST
jgi:hypothetical protein